MVDPMDETAPERRWVWATLILSSITVAAVVFAAWELFENRFFRAADYVTLHYLYITRGILSSLVLACWAAWYVLRQRRVSEEELRRSRERYRGLLESSPGAVALYDSSRQVTEWNAAAERLYGFSKADVLGRTLPTVPPEKEEELRGFLARVDTGKPVLDVETLRRDRDGATFDVQLSLLPFREEAGRTYFLEVTSDIRERVRLRQKMLEIEKLASMGQMAAGTAHHLNTPLAAMLLRVQMMQERSQDWSCRSENGPCVTDLDRLESGMRFCQHFVQRLLEFSRRSPVDKQPQEVRGTLESMASFFSPSMLAKRAQLSLDLSAVDGERVLADRNLLEALFSILLSNALDAIQPGGQITVRGRRPSPDSIEIQIGDNGCGIDRAALPQIFEPFFTTKAPGKGTGLGLAIARNIVLEHGGSVRLESTPQQGTTVFLEFPLCTTVPHRVEVRR
jgi:PAS domain S-box-containing protein